MSNKKVKCTAVAALAGTMMAGGCIPWDDVIWAAAIQSGLEFVLDNDAVFDLFEDGAVPVAE